VNIEHTRCFRCQHQNRPQAKFCEQCGGSLGNRCPSCAASVSPGATFCSECGFSLSTVMIGAAIRTPQSTYAPKHLKRPVLTSKSSVRGEGKQVTVLFCDIVQSTRLAELLGPEQMHELLDRALKIMADAVRRYEGTVNRFLGDGLMALFGAPLAIENNALRAVEAAIAIRKAVKRFSRQIKREKKVAITVRMGLNTGLVVAGDIGDHLTMEYTASGTTTHLAAHLQQAAEPGTILLSDATYRLVHRDVKVKSAQSVLAKRKRVTAYCLVGIRSSKAARDHASTFIGRDRELTTLRDLLKEVERGHGHIVGIVGEPGVGKSRLLLEFQQTLDPGSILYVEGRCLSYTGSTPYFPILEVVRRQCS
jgi:class 3 adenylate cyclase